MIDLTPTLLSLYAKKPRKLGQFNVSDVWAIAYKYLTPQMFLKGEEVDFEGVLRMWQGRWKHAQVQEILKEMGYELEVRKEYRCREEWKLVGKADAVSETDLLEIKTSETLLSSAKDWHLYQGRLYCTMFDMPRCFILQPIVTGSRVFLKKIGEAKRDDKWFEKQMEVLDKFYKELS